MSLAFIPIHTRAMSDGQRVYVNLPGLVGGNLNI
jgi:hypothetical protein